MSHSCMEASFGRNNQEETMEVEDDEGWQTVRAKKKVPRGSGASKPGSFRPGSQRVKAGERLLSTSYWKELNPTAGQVRQSDSFPRMVDILNSNSCPATVPGPPSPSEKAGLARDHTTPPFDPLEVPKSLENTILGPASSGSSAGHTPFPNRLATLARDIRRRQSRQLGCAISGSGAMDNENSGGLQISQSSSCPFNLGSRVNSRQQNKRNMISVQSENEEEGMDMVADCMEDNKKAEDLRENREMQDDRVCENSNGIQKDHIGPDLHGSRAAMDNAEKHENRLPNRKRIIGGEGKSAIPEKERTQP